MADSEGTVVRIMSIHKSKGLEFPIVFVAGMGKNFNKQDTRGKLLIDADLGIGTDYLDSEKRIKGPTLKKKCDETPDGTGGAGRGTACSLRGADACEGKTDSDGVLPEIGGSDCEVERSGSRTRGDSIYDSDAGFLVSGLDFDEYSGKKSVDFISDGNVFPTRSTVRSARRYARRYRESGCGGWRGRTVICRMTRIIQTRKIGSKISGK